MMKSPASAVVALQAYIVVASTITKVLSGSIGSEPVADGQAEPFDAGFSFEKDRVRTSVGCLLFGELGCDAECYTVTSAYGLLGTGTCIGGKVCICNFAADTTVEGIWKQKFASNDDILQNIKNDPELLQQVYRISANPFQISLQIKKKLKEALPDQHFDELKLSDSIPASRMFLMNGAVNQDVIGDHVLNQLPQVVQLSNQEFNDFDYASTLKKILQDYYNRDIDRLKQLLHQLRRTGNKSLKSILRKYPESKYKLAENAKVTHDIDPIIDNVLNVLIRRVDLGAKQGWWTKFLKNPFSVWPFTLCTSVTPDDTDENETAEQVRFVTSSDLYKLPSKVYDEILNTPCPATGKGEGYKIRYCADDNGVVLNWITKSLKVSILKNSFSIVNQNWDFGIVTISITRTFEGSVIQNWNYKDGTSTYRYEYNSANKGEVPRGKWSDGRTREGLLSSYKGFMHEWCEDNQKFIDRETCTIIKNG